MSKEIKKDRLRTNIQTVTSEFVGAEEDDEAIQAQLAQIDKVKLDIKLNEFDNVYSHKLKVAVRSGIPSSYILVDEDQEISLFSYFQDMKPTGADLERIYEENHNEFFWVPLLNWVFIFINEFVDTFDNPEELLEQVNIFLEDHDQNPFKKVDDMQSKFFQWSTDYNRSLIKDFNNVLTIIESQEFLEKLEPLQVSPLTINSERYEYSINFGEGNTPDILNVFHETLLNENIPWIISTIDPYNVIPPKNTPADPDTVLVRIMQHVPSSAWAIFPSVDMLIAHYLYFALRIDENYASIEIDISRMKMRLDIPVLKGLDQTEILKRITTSIPIKIESFEQKNVNASFSIYGIHIFEYSFADMILRDDLFNTFVVIDELMNPLSRKKRFTLQFRSSDEYIDAEDSKQIKSSVNATLNQLFSVEGQSLPIEKGKQKSSMTVPKNTGILQVSVTQSNDLKSVELFRTILSRLCTYYTQYTTTLEKEYKSFIGSVKESPLELRRIQQKLDTSGNEKSRIKTLRKQAPEVFDATYAGACFGARQPLMIQADEKEEYESEGKFVLSYPRPPENKYLFVCTDDEIPYPTIIQNKKSKNKDIFPYIPCCTKTDPRDEKDSLYHKVYVQGKTLQQISDSEGKSKHTYHTNKITGYGREGSITPESLANLLQLDTVEEVKRIGMILSPSSLIHCCLYATNNEDYMKAVKDSDKEALVRQIRESFDDYIHHGLLAQELWNMDAVERISLLTDPNIFFDYQLFYHVLEEYFNIALFAFTLKDDEIHMLKGRGYLFSARTRLDDRQCILVYQHLPESDDQLPHYELIVRKKPKQGVTKLHEKEMTEKMYNTYNLVHKTTIIQYTDKTGFTISLNAPSFTSFMNSLADRSSYQILDTYGKLRGLIVDDPKGSVMCTPMQPLNLPIWEKDLYTVPRFKPKILQQELLLDSQPDVKLNHEWFFYEGDSNHVVIQFLIDNEHTKMNRTKQQHNEDDIIPFATITTDYQGDYEQVIHERESIGYLIQAINILFIITSKPLTFAKIDKFLDKYFVVNKKIEYKFYATFKNPVIPITSVASAKTFLQWWKTTISENMINDNETSIVIPDIKQKIRDHLYRFVQIHAGDNLVVPTILAGINTDSQVKPHELLLTAYTLPIFILSKSLSAQMIETKLTQKHRLQKTIILYEQGNKLYIIQNSSSKNEAILRTLEWKNGHRNSSADLDEEVNIATLPVSEFTISASGSLIGKSPLNDKKMLSILNYSTQESSSYAAIMPL